MKKCIIIGAGDFFEHYISPSSDDFVIAADGGLLHAQNHNIHVDLLLGDMDSLNGKTKFPNMLLLPVEKDDTDTLAAIRYGIKKGFTEFHIYGGTGGRLDHTLANIQCLTFLAKQGMRGFLYAKNQIITAIANTSIRFSDASIGTVSVFATDGNAVGVSETGLKYSLNNAVVSTDFPIGVSNSFVGENAEISVKDGTLTIVYPNEAEAL